MPLYRLWRISDDKTFEVDARDDEHAVAAFSQQVGVPLTLVESDAAPPYIMVRLEKEVSWTKAPNIPVYENCQGAR